MTLVEIVVALVLLGIISSVLMRVIMRQQRFYQGANEIMTQRGQLRQATTVLPVDLRSLSSVGGDIVSVSDSMIDFRVNVGTGIVCSIVDGAKVALPPLDLANKQALTVWFGGKEPEGNESVVVYIYNDSSSLGNEDDVWQQFRLKAVHQDATKCPGPDFMGVGDLGKNRPILELTSTAPDDLVTGGPISQYIRVGAPVRLVRRVRYGLYKAGDSKWYLGYSEFDRGLGTFKQLDAVSGPYEPNASSSGVASGVAFRFYDVDGNEIASGAGASDIARIARVGLIVRGRTEGTVRAGGLQNGAEQQYRDSLAVSVMLRNRT
jgi:hypothetical protein